MSLPEDTGIFLNEIVDKSTFFNGKFPVNYLEVPKVVVLGPISSVNSSSFDSIKFFFRLKLSSAENFFYKTVLVFKKKMKSKFKNVLTV